MPLSNKVPQGTTLSSNRVFAHFLTDICSLFLREYPWIKTTRTMEFFWRYFWANRGQYSKFSTLKIPRKKWTISTLIVVIRSHPIIPSCHSNLRMEAVFKENFPFRFMTTLMACKRKFYRRNSGRSVEQMLLQKWEPKEKWILRYV